jgi:hypothetical protein
MKHKQRRTTFKEILRQTQSTAAREAWRRARLASQLRHLARRQGNRRAAFRLAGIKRAAIFRAVLLSPSEVRVTIDRRPASPLISIKFNRDGALHLPLRGTHRGNLIILGLGRASASTS